MIGGHLLGIMQGRLTNAPKGEGLDWFPFNSWRDEFSLAKDLGFLNVEFVIDREKSKKNPIWSQSGRESIIDAFNANNITPLACCFNFVIDYPIVEKENIDDCLKAIKNSSFVGFRYAVIPLFQASDVESCNIVNLVNSLNILMSAAKCCDIQLLLETNLSGRKTLNLVSQLGGEIGIVYDIGNATQCGHDIEDDLHVLSTLIKHVHIKDKDSNGENVELGFGNVLFEKFFKKLKEINYKGSYTLETSRGFDAIERARSNMQFVDRFLY